MHLGRPRDRQQRLAAWRGQPRCRGGRLRAAQGHRRAGVRRVHAHPRAGGREDLEAPPVWRALRSGVARRAADGARCAGRCASWRPRRPHAGDPRRRAVRVAARPPRRVHGALEGDRPAGAPRSAERHRSRVHTVQPRPMGRLHGRALTPHRVTRRDARHVGAHRRHPLALRLRGRTGPVRSGGLRSGHGRRRRERGVRHQ